MCIIAFAYRQLPDAYLVLGANREEAYDRPGTEPRLLSGKLNAVGGIDPLARGTWLGVNERGVLVAVTNRPKRHVRPNPRSRGLLARDLLEQPTARDATNHAMRELETGAYAGCNYLVIDAESASVVHSGDALSAQALSSGIHVLTSANLDDDSDTRGQFARKWLTFRLGTGLGRQPRTTDEFAADLRSLLSQSDPVRVCIHGPDRGTVSSSLFTLRDPLRLSTYLHAQGSPDMVPYRDYSDLFQALSVSRDAE